MNESEIRPDTSGAYTNPDKLRELAQQASGLSPAIRCFFLRAAKEIERQRNYIEQLQAIIDAS